MYEKNPDFFCKECHKSFKNQRGLDAHNEAKHPPDLIFIDEAIAGSDRTEFTPKEWESLNAPKKN